MPKHGVCGIRQGNASSSPAMSSFEKIYFLLQINPSHHRYPPAFQAQKSLTLPHALFHQIMTQQLTHTHRTLLNLNHQTVLKNLSTSTIHNLNSPLRQLPLMHRLYLRLNQSRLKILKLLVLDAHHAFPPQSSDTVLPPTHLTIPITQPTAKQCHLQTKTLG